MNIKNKISLGLILLCIGTTQTIPYKRVTTTSQTGKVAPCVATVTCTDYCPKAERAANRRISAWQDPLLAEQLQAEYEHLKNLCAQQNPAHHFTEERALAQQEMTDID